MAPTNMVKIDTMMGTVTTGRLSAGIIMDSMGSTIRGIRFRITVSTDSDMYA
eukprot:CAMPEP_0203925768 /NCGR_PEP_ID=MMETSP0359-20131031/65362_1 /ASSEMBLY_ACC=CAM_ASM_000338 /TAXON_ID=268821 /ORGANISM="Scrippsiella Hangoei, Strain SHTV-5" /LENGTH=51 /DNA_ID=CAMNT_0050854241 /DNA_START=13 /DNA_END=168 /DNA_ORIENTATION=-